MASSFRLRSAFLILQYVISINIIICVSSSLLYGQGSQNPDRHVPPLYVATSKESNPSASYASVLIQSPTKDNPGSHSDQNGSPSKNKMAQPQSDSSATVNLFVSNSDKEKTISRLIGASSTIMDYNEDTRKYMPRNIPVAKPRTKQLGTPVHKRPSSRQNTLVSSSSPSESDVTDAGNPWKIPSEDKVKPSQVPRKHSRASPGRRLHLAIPVRMFLYKSGNGDHNSRHDVLRQGELQYTTAEDARSSRRIYIPIRFNDDNMLLTTASHEDCVQCPENFTISPERGSSYVQVPVPEITVCPYLAFVPGRLNVVITSGPRVGSLVAEGEYPVELLVWKRGGYTYSCKFTFTVKVAECPPLPASNMETIHCTNGTQWGSQCHVTCPPNYVAAGPSSIKCEGPSERLMWTNDPPKCIPTKKIDVVKNGLSCAMPRSPTGGTVLCDKEASGNHYKDGTVCQYFCFPDYTISSGTPNSSLAVCLNGTWSPDYEITCAALYCARPPQPQRGYVQCNEPATELIHMNHQISTKSKYHNGIVCKFQCEIGYVVPSSKLPVDVIICTAPEWNISSIPDCKRAVPPTYNTEDCKNKTVITEPGIKARINLPKFTSSRGLPLKPTCSLPASLPKGLYMNFCEATDPEFRTTSTCSYHIKIIERVEPQSHPKDCQDQVLTAGRSGTAILKPTRFLVMKMEKQHLIKAKCTYSKRIGIGTYTNNCTATDPELNTSASCSFTVTVKGLSCPQLPVISNGKAHCHPKPRGPSTYPPGTTCIFKCHDGYVVTNSRKKWRRWQCLPQKLQWSQSKVPKCRRAITPKPYANDCHHKTLFLKGRKAIWPKKPRFKSTFKGAKLKVRCSLNRPLTAGLYTNFCEAKDLEMRTSISCTYNITVKAKDCPSLPEVPHSNLHCSPTDVSFGYQVGVVCRHQCHPGYTIPSSMLDYEAHRCIAFRKWNTSVLPSCVSEVAPQPTDSSCLHEILAAEDPLMIHWSVPSFVSSTGMTLQTNCEPSNITEYGVYNISCYAYDPELRLNGSCEFSLDIQKPDKIDELESEPTFCPELPEVPQSKLECSPDDIYGYLIGTVCRYTCLPGYVIPSSLQDFAVRNCTVLQNWNTTILPSCLHEVSPHPSTSSCADEILEIDEPREIHYSVPEFLSSIGTPLHAECEPSKITSHGIYNISCSAYDPELRLNGSCTFTLEVHTTEVIDESDTKVEGCQTPGSVPNGELKCSSEDSLIQPLASICIYTCLNGYAIPLHRMHLSVITCTSDNNWNSTETPTCEAVSPAFLHPSCPNQSVNATNPADVAFEIPEINTTRNEPADVSCSPQKFETFGKFEITCEAHDVFFGISAFCKFMLTSFQLYLPEASSTESIFETPETDTSVPTQLPKADAPNPTESSCLDQVISTEDQPVTNWTVPDFVASYGTILKAVCEPSEVKEYGVHNISCSAHDIESNTTGSCEFTLEVLKLNITEESDTKLEGCQIPESGPNGELKCSDSSVIQPLQAVCSHACLDGYSIPFHQLHLATIVCIDKHQWNSTETPGCEAVSSAFRFPTCPDQSANVSDFAEVSVKVPEITTTRNGSASVSCNPQRFEEFGTFEVSCEAHDPFFGISTFCTFMLTVSELYIAETSKTESNLIIPDVHGTVPTPSPGTLCETLTSPSNGHLSCTSNETSDYCNASCNAGYHFPSTYHSMGSNTLSCDRSTGLWNFQKDYGIADVPDCLGELPTTSWQVWLKFKVEVENCDDNHVSTLQDEIQAWLLVLNGNVCNITVDCSKFQYHCGEDTERDSLTLEVTWTVEASFNPEDYENDDDIVPNAETQIEMVVENTQRAVTVEKELRNQLELHAAGLLQDSYRQGKFTLVCQRRGFVVDPQSDKCVECPSGTFEVNGVCEPCSVNHYQDKTGQFSCIPCPTGTISASGNRNPLECKE